MLPVSSPSSTALSITLRFSPSMADPTASKKPKNAPNSGRASAAEAGHDFLSFKPTLLTIPFAIPAYWTPEQALAVIELLDDLRELIWAYYGMQLIDEVREQHVQTRSDRLDPPHP